MAGELGIAPLKEPMVDASGRVQGSWLQWLPGIFQISFSVVESGTTLQRPTKNLWIGRQYFDTDLGLPIFYKNPGWVKADGTAA